MRQGFNRVTGKLGLTLMLTGLTVWGCCKPEYAFDFLCPATGSGATTSSTTTTTSETSNATDSGNSSSGSSDTTSRPLDIAASLQGIVQTKVGMGGQWLDVESTHDPAEVNTFLQTHMFRLTGQNPALATGSVLLTSWRINYGEDTEARAQFKEANGQVHRAQHWLTNGARIHWRFAPSEFNDGQEHRGRMEWYGVLPDGKRALLVHSQDFVMVKALDALEPLTVPMRAEVTNSLVALNKVTITNTIDGGPQGLYDAVRKKVNNRLPEQTVNGYYQFDQLWQAAGGTVETSIQPGTLVGQTRSAIGDRVVAKNVNPLPSGIEISFEWPSQEVFDRFKAPDGTFRPVTGYLMREYKLDNGQVALTLLGNQVTWGIAPRDPNIQRRRGGGGSDVAPAAPTITAVSPSSSVAGTSITITGTNFRAGAAVTIGGSPATVTASTATSLTVTVPVGLAAGTYNVVVTNTDNTTGTSVGAFTVPAPPTIAGIVPNNGAIGSSTTINGTNFRTGATVTIGGSPATVTASTTTSLTVTVPNGLAAAAQNVVVTNTDGTTVTSVGGFTVSAGGSGPTITAGVYQAANGLPFTIEGTNFVAGATMTIGGQDANGNVTSSTTIDGIVPAGLAGGGTQYDIVITNPDMSSVTLPNGFMVF